VVVVTPDPDRAHRRIAVRDPAVHASQHPFDTGAPRYRWLTTGLFVAAGRRLGTGHIEYAVHRIT